ncbi:WD40-repeat-containing domain protein [Aspergillus heterothallicus]
MRKLASNCGEQRGPSLESNYPQTALPYLPRRVSSLAFSPDGKLLAYVLSDRTIKLLNSATGRVCRFIARHRSDVVGVLFLPCRKFLATMYRDNILCIWHIDHMPFPMFEGYCYGSIMGIAFSPNSVLLAAASSDNMVTLCDISTNEVLSGQRVSQP